MLASDPHHQFEELKDQLLKQISQTFPVKDRSGRFEVRVSDLKVEDRLGVDDIKDQFKAKMEGRSWAAPIVGTIEIVDTTSGKTLVSKKNLLIAKIPKLTRHYSYIIGGSEKFIANQWRLRPGVYVKATEKPGEFEAQFQLAKGRSFDLQLGDSGEIYMKLGSRKIPLYSVLNAMGVDDDAMKKAWGADVYEASRKKAKVERDLKSLYEAWRKEPIGDKADLVLETKAIFEGTRIDPVVAHANVGVKSEQVDGRVLFEASKKLLDVAAKRKDPDPIDSLRYKELWTAKDQFVDRIAKAAPDIESRIQRALGKPTVQRRLLSGDNSVLRDVFMPDLIQRPLYHVFTTSLASNGKQTNPISMLSDRSLVTITGPGGIQNPHALSKSNTALDPSHLGFLDPVFTPESNAGVNTHLTFGVSIKDRKPYIRLYNMKTGKMEDVDAATAAVSNVVLPDQVRWEKGVPKPLNKTVRMSDSRGQIRDDIAFSSADYVMPSAAQVFAVETNLVPFMQNDSAGRSTMSARHMAQAISVIGREPPKVQVEAGAGKSFESLIGSGFLAHRAKADGVVKEVKKDEIVIQGKDGTYSVHLYHHYPTNDLKGQLHSVPLVKPGDRVRAGQIVADNNYTKNGTLALGTNLRVAYLANGSNHEDGIVISRSAAERLASEHLYKPSMLVSDTHVIGKKEFLISKPGVYSKDRIDKIGDDGIVKPGTKVKPGDPLVLALSEVKLPGAADINAKYKLGKRLRNKYQNSSMIWDGDYEAEVVRAERIGKNIVVHLKTLEPAQIGSKLSTRHSAKGIVTQILDDKDMPHDEKGRPVEMLINPTCYDEKTEFLTKRGWVFGADLSEDDVFATMNPENFYIEWQRASRIVKEPYRGKMYRLKNQQLDLLVTPNHRMFTAPKVKGHAGTLGVLDFDRVDPKHFTDETAEEIFGQTRRYLKAGRWKGHDPLEFVISCGAKIESDPKAGWSVPSHLWAEFMGWFLSKGFTCLEENGGYVVGISQTRANPENRKRIKKLLESMGFEPTETENGYVIYHKGLYERLEPLGGANEKYIPREILDLPPQHLELFLNAFIADDGNTRWEPERGRYGTRRLSSNSKALIDDLQEICIKLGYAANIREDHRTEKSRTGHHYTMSFGPRCKAPWVNWDRTTKANQTEEWVEYDGMVYCCTVPNGFIVTRRNGVHVIAGQSVPGRMNPGQLLETAAGKIADKTGRPYFIRNFQGGVDYLKKIQDELKKHGLKDTETLYDPKTGRKLGDIMVGPHYVFQLEHQIDKKTHVRAGGYGSELFQFDAPKIYYDNDTRIPRGGGHTGAQSLGSLGIYAALAAGLKDNLREMQTLKSDQPQAREVWGALANGERIPAPKIPFVFKKFEAMLTGLGVNVEKSGSEIRLMPRSDAETRALSRGEITRPTRSIRGKDDKPEPGGLFDPNITGGPAGQHWGHIELVEAMPNPVYARAIAHTLGIKEADIPKIIEGKAKLPNGEIGAKAFRDALKSIDIDKEIKATVAALKDPRVKGTQLDKLHFKYHALKTVKDAGKRLDEAWTIKAVPVLPPVFRPQVTLPDGTIKNNPLNALYKRLGMVNESLKRGEGKVPYNNTLDARAGLYQELSNLFGTTPKGKKALDLDMRGTREDPDKTLPGIIHMLSGDQPKDGFFQDKMIEKKQDYTARATIVVDPNLSVDEIGLPKKIAIELMRPMVARRLIQARIRPDEAQKMISRKDPIAIKALEQEVQHRPVLMKRDPVLHQYGLVAQRVKLTDDPAIKVSPLILPPLGGDIDGDTVALMVPLTQEAVEEAKRIMPSQRTLSDSSGDVLFAPANESALSLYRMSIPRGKYQGVIKDKDEAEALFRANRINLNQQIHVKGVGDTTLGRLRIAEILPEKFRQEVLTKLDKPFDRKVQESILKDIAKNMPKHFVETVDGMSRLGFRMAYESGHTVGLKDIEPLREHRDKIIANTMKEVARMKARGADDTKTTEAWLQATRKIHDVYNEVLKGKPTNVSDMAPAPLGSGIKAKREQFQGLIMAPMLVEDHLGTPSKVPITKSFAEGIDVGGYFLQAAGARRGVIQKTDSVREPGYMSKLLVQANIDQPITAADCGTTQGMLMPVTHKDIVDRHLAMDVKIGDYTFNAGTVVTPDILAKAKEKGIDQLVVRSPLKCRMPHGVCSKCMGVHPSGKEYHIGENVGIVAAQALGERAAQLMLKQTHGGGIVPTAGYSVSEFSEVQRLFDAAKRGREDAALAPNNGKIVGVYQSKAGDWIIQFERGQVKTRQKPLPHIKPGVEVKRGDKLTTGDPNIHDLLATKGLDAVQSHMVDKIGTIYGREGVLRRHVELAVRSATGVVRITDPGDHDGYVRGDYVQKSVIDEINRGVLKGKEPIKYQPILLPTKMIPLRRQEDWIARLQGERLGQSLLRGIQHGHRSNVTGRHPIPALAVGVTVGAPPDARPFGTAVH